MGAIISRWRKKPSTQDVLSKLQGQISSLESTKRDTMAWQKKLIGYMLLYFSLLYLFAAGVAYFRFFHDPAWQSLNSQAMLWVPFLIAPFVFLIVRRLLSWWYHRKIRRNETQLIDLVKKRKTILDEVMETETYKVAKEILEKYAPEQLVSKQQTQQQQAARGPTPRTGQRPGYPASTPLSGQPAANMEVRRRLNATAAGSPALRPNQGGGAGAGQPAGGPGRTPAAAGGEAAGGPRRNTPQLPTSSMAIAGGPSRPLPDARQQIARQNQSFMGDDKRGLPPGPPLPRPVLARERGYMDKMVEYLVGDGPSNRYALICKQCQSHNGMALKEEFEYIAYRCCYCYYWNPARKQRPVAPRLPSSSLSRQSSTDSSDDDKAASSSSATPSKRSSPTAPSSQAATKEEDKSEKEDETKKEQEEAKKEREEETLKMNAELSEESKNTSSSIEMIDKIDSESDEEKVKEEEKED